MYPDSDNPWTCLDLGDTSCGRKSRYDCWQAKKAGECYFVKKGRDSMGHMQYECTEITTAEPTIPPSETCPDLSTAEVAYDYEGATSVERGDLAFAMDITGSMGEELATLKTALVNIVRSGNISEEKSAAFVRGGIVLYSDPSAVHQMTTSDTHALSNEILSYGITYEELHHPATAGLCKPSRAMGMEDWECGGDCPEFGRSGIDVALANVSHYSNIVLISDAGNSDRDTISADTVVDKAVSMNTKVHFVLTSDCEDSLEIPHANADASYLDIAERTGGTVFHVTKDNVGTELLSIVESLAEDAKNPFTHTREEYPASTNEIMVSDLHNGVSHVTMTVMGTDPFIECYHFRTGEVLPAEVLLEVSSSKSIRIARGGETGPNFKGEVRCSSSASSGYTLKVTTGYMAELDSHCKNFCEGGATCTHHEACNLFTCKCKNGTAGDYCTTKVKYDFCLSGPCFHGTCIDGEAGYTCECEEGYKGKRCGRNIDDCAEHGCVTGTCVDGIGEYTCKCDVGFFGEMCTDMETSCGAVPDMDCGSGTCVDGRSSHMPLTCTCESGWEGDDCKDSIDDCPGHGCVHGWCIDGHESHTCGCEAGYEGPTCDVEIDECDEKAFCGHGTCVDDIAKYTCDCEDGYEGDDCTKNIDECVAEDGTPTDCGHGSCVDGIFSYTCTCEEGWEGDLCDSSIDDCDVDIDCGHGDCTDGHMSWYCTCRGGWMGDRCGGVDPCYGVPCEVGTCAGGVCTCDPGWTGDACDTNIDDCAGDVCGEHGKCTDLVFGYECVCEEGWGEGGVASHADGTSFDCKHHITDCDTMECVHGTCSWGECECEEGWEGELCADSIDDCATSRCGMRAKPPKGTCTDGHMGYTCECAEGWGPWGEPGTGCLREVDPCDTPGLVPCEFGFCMKGECRCYKGFEGDDCSIDIDECADSPCGSHGTCVDGRYRYTCECEKGWGPGGLALLGKGETTHCDTKDLKN